MVLYVCVGLCRHIVDKDALPTLFALARSLDVASQRYATLSICNLSAGDLKSQVRRYCFVVVSLRRLISPISSRTLVQY